MCVCIWILLFYLSLCVYYFVFFNAIDQLLYRLFLNILLIISVLFFNKTKTNLYVCEKESTNCYLLPLFFLCCLFIEFLLWRYSIVFLLLCSLFFWCWFMFLNDVVYLYINTCDFVVNLYFLLFFCFFSWLLKNHSNKN